DQADRLAHPQPAVGGQDSVILSERQLLTVSQGQSIYGLDALIDHITDVTGREFARRLVENSDTHASYTPPCIAEALPAGDERSHRTSADPEFACNRALASSCSEQTIDRRALLVA